MFAWEMADTVQFYQRVKDSRQLFYMKWQGIFAMWSINKSYAILNAFKMNDV